MKRLNVIKALHSALANTPLGELRSFNESAFRGMHNRDLVKLKDKLAVLSLLVDNQQTLRSNRTNDINSVITMSREHRKLITNAVSKGYNL